VLAEGLAEVAAYQPWRLDLLEQDGLNAFQGEDYKGAAGLLERAESADRLSPLGYLYLGDALRQTGDLDAALAAWEVAGPGVGAEEIPKRLLEIHTQAGDIPALTSDLQTLVGLRPADVRLRYRLGLHLAALQPEAALPHLAQAADLDPGLKPAAEQLIASIRTALLEEDPAYTLLESGRGLATLGEWALAAQAFRGAVDAAPEYAEAWAYLGEARQQTVGSRPKTAGAASEAVVVFPEDGLVELEKALDLDPGSLAANTLLALYWQRQGNFETALEYLEKVTALHPDDPALQAQLGSTLALSGDLEAAYQAYRRGVELAPLRSEPWRLLAEFCILHEYSLKEEGLPAARRAASLDPKNPASLDTLGQVVLLLEDFSTARRFFESAITVDPSYAPALVHLGLVYALEGDTQGAYNAWREVGAAAPGTPAAEQAERLIQNYFP
jgi:tetratricopeptide (TPR) repeat protein